MRIRVTYVVFSVALLSSTVSAQWVQTNGLDTMVVTGLVAAGNELFAATNLYGVYRSTDDGESWAEANTGLARRDVVGLFGDERVLLMLPFSGGAFLSTDNGTNWTEVTSLPWNNRWPTCFAAHDTSLYVGLESGGGGVLRSTDAGKSWKMVDSGLEGNSDVSVLRVLGDGLGGATLLAGATVREGEENTGQWHGRIYLSADDGTSWKSVNSGLLEGYFRVNSFGATAAVIFAGVDEGLLVSSDQGNHWERVRSWPPHQRVYSFAVNGTSVFAGTANSMTGAGWVFLTTDDGKTWEPVNRGLPEDTWVDALAVIRNNLFAGTGPRHDGTGGRGVWRRPLAEMVTGVGDGHILPLDFQLDQNYPNPFNPSTTIRFELSMFSMVRLSVYDILGREVSVLVNERKDAGVYKVEFDRAGLSSGVYFYRMQAGDFVQSKKLLLLR